MLIRDFRKEDIDSILELFHHTVHSVAAKYYSAEQLQAWAPPIDSIDKEKWLNSLNEGVTFVAERNQDIIGFIQMTPSGYIDRMFVAKSQQGSGAARLLWKKLEAKARILGIEELTAELSIMAKPLAERQGFRVIRKQEKLHNGSVFINYVMSKKL